MEIENQFNLVADEYDSNRKKFVPCFDDFYINATNFIAVNIPEPKKVLDLGAGTGLLTELWLKHFSKAEYILIDVAADMLKIAEKRFADNPNVTCRVGDYTKRFPAGTFDAIISALSIHHLEDATKVAVFEKIYKKLAKGGLFVNYDQFCTRDSKLNDWYDFYWRQQLKNSGLTAHDLELFEGRVQLDRECSVQAEIEMLNRAGFEIVQCIYTCQKFSVIVAMKEGDYQIDDKED